MTTSLSPSLSYAMENSNMYGQIKSKIGRDERCILSESVFSFAVNYKIDIQMQNMNPCTLRPQSKTELSSNS